MEVYKWMEWVIMRNHSLCEVDDPITRSMSRLGPVSSKTLLAYMQHVTSKIGAQLVTSMGDKFGLMFDGWSCGTLHFVGIYGVYEKDGALKQPLLAVSPAEYGQSADAHIEMIYISRTCWRSITCWRSMARRARCFSLLLGTTVRPTKPLGHGCRSSRRLR